MDFIDWLEAEMKERGWRVADLARGTKLSQSHLSRIIARERLIGHSAALAIASAFGLPEDDVLRRAGLLRPTWQQAANEDLSIGQIVELVRQMDAAEREELYEYALYRINRPKRDSGAEDARQAKPLRTKAADEQ